MGEMADWIIEQGEPPDDFGEPEPSDYLDMTDDELRQATSGVRSEKLKGIRKWEGALSEKQRYCLAAWLADKDGSYR